VPRAPYAEERLSTARRAGSAGASANPKPARPPVLPISIKKSRARARAVNRRVVVVVPRLMSLAQVVWGAGDRSRIGREPSHRMQVRAAMIEMSVGVCKTKWALRENHQIG
jgi:hypothetical protein